TEGEEGVARSLDPDDNATFCDAVDPYGDGDLGTPGAANPSCPVQLEPGQCLDGDMARDIVGPTVGDLVITEFIPNPDNVSDGNGEWIEFHALGSFDLNDLELGEQGEVEFTYDGISECQPVNPGDTILMARNGDPDSNGGLPEVDITYGTAISLTNGGDDFFLGYDGVVVDTVMFTGSSEGAARSLDPNAYDPVDNDDEANFCDATLAYNADDFGTPGEQNPACN
ncbi:MAG: hypothetical protein ACPG4T_18635, partial [Nannocystaceae bacterium]